MYKLIDHLAAEDSISTFVIMSLVLKLGTKIMKYFNFRIGIVNIDLPWLI